VQYERDLLGRVTNSVNARGQRIAFTYDADGSLAAVTNDGTRLAMFAYDAAGDLAGMTTAQGTTTYFRDGRRMVTGFSIPTVWPSASRMMRTGTSPY
jgi:YD repeat-containing protein